MQDNLDKMTGALVDMYSPGILTNYLHGLRAGHFKQMMLKWGYLGYYSADSVEAMNGDMILFWYNSQRGGNSGSNGGNTDAPDGHGRRHALMIEGICRRSCQKVLVSSGKFDVIIAEHNARMVISRALRNQMLKEKGYIGGRKLNFAATRAASNTKKLKRSLQACGQQSDMAE